MIVRLHPNNNWYYYLQSCTLSGEMAKSYTVKTNAKGWASFSAVQPVGLPAGLKAYAATDINETHVKLNELTQVAAEEGVFVNGAPSTEYTLNVLEARVTKEEYDKAVEIAKTCGLSLSDYIRRISTGHKPRRRLSDKEAEALSSLSDARGDILRIVSAVRDIQADRRALYFGNPQFVEKWMKATVPLMKRWEQIQDYITE